MEFGKKSRKDRQRSFKVNVTSQKLLSTFVQTKLSINVFGISKFIKGLSTKTSLPLRVIIAAWTGYGSYYSDVVQIYGVP